ncbi:phage major capsid protein [Phaeospirillum tilakii]|uniref:Phage major capsid protein n=1 Tax=Phaeospirillum tilakii TaxID=741673 RepID=A0ABW5CDB8_9PROT
MPRGNDDTEFKTAPEPGDLPKVIEQLGSAFEEFKAKIETEQKEIKAGLRAAPADLTKVEKALDGLQAAKDAIEAKAAAERKRLDDLEKLLRRPGGGGGADLQEAELKSFNLLTIAHANRLSRPRPTGLQPEDYASYRKGFEAYLRGGDQRIDEADRKAMSVGSDPDGGLLVQADVTGRIVSRVYETCPIRQIAATQTISTDALKGVIDNDEAGDMVMVGETTAPGATSTPQIGEWRIPVFEGAVEPKATQQLLEDAAVDVEAWLAKKVADKIARGQNRRFVLGNGVNEPRGLATYPTAATGDGSRSWGTLEHVATGVSGAFASSNPADILFDLIGAFKDAYLQNARFLTRREVITMVRKFKETGTGQYLWQPGLQAGQPQQLVGFPVTIAQDMPALSAGSLSLAFGDFAEGYQIVDRLGMTTIRDNLTLKPYIKFYTRVRFGGGVLNFEAVKFIKFGA